MLDQPNDAAGRLTKLFNDIPDIAAVVVVVGGMMSVFLPGVRHQWRYVAASFAIGCAAGLGTRWSGFHDGWVLMIAVGATILGPTLAAGTVAAIEGKSIMDVYREIRGLKNGDRE